MTSLVWCPRFYNIPSECKFDQIGSQAALVFPQACFDDFQLVPLYTLRIKELCSSLKQLAVVTVAVTNLLAIDLCLRSYEDSEGSIYAVLWTSAD